MQRFRMKITHCPQLPPEEIARLRATILAKEDRCLDGTPGRKSQTQIAHEMMRAREYGKVPK